MIVIKKKKNNTTYIIIAIAIIAIIMIGVLCILINSIVKSTQKGTKTNTNTNSTTTTSEQTDEEQISEEDEIKQLSESARMKRYIGNFFNNIEDGDYQSAYNVLNEDFKKTNALKSSIKGAKDFDLVYSKLDKDKIKYEKNDKGEYTVSGIDEQIKDVKEKYSFLFDDEDDGSGDTEINLGGNHQKTPENDGLRQLEEAMGIKEEK